MEIVKTILFLIILSITTHLEATELCSRQGELLDPIMGVGKGWLGVRCHALNWMTWKPEWKSPCQCLDQQDTWSRLKRKWPKNKRKDQEKLENTTAKIEKKIADTILTQITYNLEQSIRLDIYLKKGIVSTQNLFPNNQNFPSSCRIQKIGELITGDKTNVSNCNPKIKEKRLQLLFGKGKSFDDWYKDQKKNVFKDAVTNSLSEKDREAGMCLPYKSFLSINNINPLRTSYLKLASAFGDNYEGFLQWVTNRNDPNDIDSTIKNLNDAKNSKLPHTGSAMDLLAKAKFNEDEDNGFLSVKKTQQFEKIDENDIQKLLKTDPIFERMVRDKEFFKYISKNANTDQFNPNDPKMLAKMIESQNKGCESLYGSPSKGIDNKSSTVFGSQKASQKTQPVEDEKNLLTRFLCEEDFPKEFITNDVITSFLAPELKKELNVQEEDAEDMIVDYLYCKGPSPKEYEDGRISYDMGPSVATGMPKKNDLSNLLNFKLNPASDLQTPKDDKNDYANFNNSVCKFIDADCKKADTAQDPKCYISTIAVSVPYQMLLTKFSKQDATDIAKKITNPDYTDKEIRDLLKKLSMGTFDKETEAIIIMRHQQLKFKAKEDEDELRYALGSKIQPDQKLSEYFASIPGGRDAALDSLLSTRDGRRNYSDLVTRLRKTNELRKSDTLIGDNSASDRSSFFSNYFALGKEEDEKKISDYKTTTATTGTISSNSSNQNTSIGTGNHSGSSINTGVSTGNTGGQIPTVSNTDTPVFYERRSFDDPLTTPPIDSKKLISQDTPSNNSKNTPSIQNANDTTRVASNRQDSTITKSTGNIQQNSAKINNGRLGLTLTSNDSSNDEIGQNNSASDLDKQRRDLERRLNKLNDELNKYNNDNKIVNNDDQLSNLNKEKRDLEDQLRRIRNNTNDSQFRRNSSNDNTNSGFANNDWKNNYNNWNTNNSGTDNNTPYNNGYDKGREFDKEKARRELDDGSSNFDPDNKKEKTTTSSGGGGSGDGKKGNKGALTLSSGLTGDEDGESPSGENGKKRRRKNGNYYDEEIKAKCGDGPIVSCIFPNSYFTDPEDEQAMYTTIANLHLEGKKFKTLEKVRPSKKEMKAGEKPKAKYYLYTYDVVLEDSKREVNDEERNDLYKLIKENRRNPDFKKKLIKIRFMTKKVPPKILLSDQEAIEATSKTITPEEYEQMGLSND